MSTKKKEVFVNSVAGSVAALLDKFQQRLTKYANEVSQLKGAVAGLLDRERIASASLQDVTTEIGKQQNTNREVTDSLYKLRESTQKSFNGVSQDVASILKAVQRLNERVGQVEGQNLILVEENKVLRDQSTRNSKRLQELEDSVKPAAFYLGHEVRSSGNLIRINGADFFPFPEAIAELKSEVFGVVVTLKNGDKYILCGGPSPATMFINKVSSGRK